MFQPNNLTYIYTHPRTVKWSKLCQKWSLTTPFCLKVALKKTRKTKLSTIRILFMLASFDPSLCPNRLIYDDKICIYFHKVAFSVPLTNKKNLHLILPHNKNKYENNTPKTL